MRGIGAGMYKDGILCLMTSPEKRPRYLRSLVWPGLDREDVAGIDSYGEAECKTIGLQICPDYRHR